MDAFYNISRTGEGLKALVDQYYHYDTVEGFALGVHDGYISTFRSEFGKNKSVNQILESQNRPKAWKQICQNFDLPDNLSPIYIVIYISISIEEFNNAYPQLERVTPDNHYVLVHQKEKFTANSDRGKHRPSLIGGISTSNSSAHIAGTLGGFLKDTVTGKCYLSSCNHVFDGPFISDIIQPGRADLGHSPTDHVANLTHTVPLNLPVGFAWSDPFNSVDAAAAQIVDDPLVVANTSMRIIGPVSGIAAASSVGLGDDVAFVGKESDRVEARIYRFISRLKVTIGPDTYNFGEVFELEPRMSMYFGTLSQKGDSGSWIIQDSNMRSKELCGILFAGNGFFSICCFMETVIKELDKLSIQRFEVA